jgi:hypothetical protein
VNDTFSPGDHVFVLANNGSSAVECKIIVVLASGCDYVVEPVECRYLSTSDRRPANCHIFKDKAAAFRAVAAHWVAVRDVAEANRARAVEQSIA